MESNQIIQSDLETILESKISWEKLEGKTILISGANGMLPSYILKTLLYYNDCKATNKIKVIGLVRNLEKAKMKFRDYGDRKDLVLINNHLNEKLEIDGDVNFIIHAASQASPKYYNIDPVGTALPNTVGTYNLLNLAVEKKVDKFLFFSTSEVYGHIENSEFISESDLGVIDCTNIRSCYAESKRMGETLCVCYSHQYGLDVSIVRPFHTYGPGLELNDGRVFADFVSNIIENRDIEMKSDGSAIRSFCYISDATSGFLTVLLHGKDKEAYNIANPHCEVTIRELAETLVTLFPEKNLKAIFKTDDNKNYLKSDFKKLTPSIKKVGELGWEPVVGIELGFKNTILSNDLSN